MSLSFCGRPRWLAIIALGLFWLVQPNSALAADQDGDGMPDDWESAHGFRPDDASDAILDADGDGFRNLHEYLADTDPLNAFSYLGIYSINLLGDQVTVCFSTRAGHSYIVEYAATVTGPWQSLQPIVGSGAGTCVSHSPGGAQGYYRIAHAGAVYSVNTVGFVRLSQSASWNLTANQFLTVWYQLQDLMPLAPDSTLLWKVGISGFEQNFFDGNDGLWYDYNVFPSTTTLRPGEGALVYAPEPFTQTFVGEVPQGALTNRLSAGLSLCSSIVPQAGGITTGLGFPAQNGDVIYRFDRISQTYTSFIYDGIGGMWYPSEPVLAVGEAFWVELGTARNWSRNFSTSGGTFSYTVAIPPFTGTRGGMVPTNDPPIAPTISAQPQSRTNVVGDNVTFTVTASGSAPLQYQWRFGGAPIPGGTLSNYTLLNVQTTSAGSYSVVVSNAYASVTSTGAILTVQTPVCVPPAAGMIGWWAGEGNADDVFGANHGTLQNGATLAPGKVGQAFSFDGLNDRVFISESSSVDLSRKPAWTINAWVKPASFDNVSWPTIYSEGYYWISLGIHRETGALESWIHNTHRLIGAVPMELGNWNHVALTYDSTNRTLYLNGAVVGAGYAPTIAADDSGSAIGNIPVAGSDQARFQGEIDEVAIFNRSLTSNEIAAIYAARSAGMCPQTAIVVDGIGRVGSVTVTNSAQVQVTTTIANPVIFYTLNGAYPGTGLIYQGPFTLNQSSTVRALAYAADFSSSVESATVAITVVKTPSIVEQPLTQTRLVGQTASFHVEAVGSGPLLYQWFLNQIPLMAETNSTLVVPNLQSANAGEYRVRVQNSYGSVVSAAALLSVYELPSITSQPSGVTVAVSNFVSFTVSAGGTGPLRYQWRQNGVNIPDATNSVYTRSAVQISDGGSYTVVVANDYGTVMSVPANLVIIFTFLQPSDQFAGAVPIIGTHGTVYGNSGSATKEPGEPNHAGKTGGRSVWYQWQAPSSGVVSFDLVGSTFDTLLAVYTGTNLTNLNVVASSDDYQGPGEVLNPLTSAVQFQATAGVTYRIAIDGSGGSEGHLILGWNLEPVANVPPIVTQQPRDAFAVIGGNATFNVVATGTPPLFYQWNHNGVWITGATNSTLVVSDAQLTNIGHYAVFVANSVGVSSSSLATLELVSQGAEPTENKFEDIDNNLPMGGFATLNGKGPPNFVSVSSGTIGYDFFDNTSSSGSPFDPAHCAIGGASRWIAFLPQISGMMSVDTITSQVATVVAVYRASRTTELTPANFVACDVNSAPDGHSLVRFPVQAGTVYSVLVDGLNGAKGQIYLHYCLGTVPIVNASATMVVIREGETLTLAGQSLGGDPPPAYQWYRNGQLLAGATSVSYSRNNFSAQEAGVYSLMASNCLGISSNVIGRVTVDVPLTLSFLASRLGGQFDFHVTGSASRGFVIQGSTNFLNWIPLYTNVTPMAPVNFADPASASQPLRFYRAIPWGQ
jgi:hypothetical protein